MRYFDKVFKTKKFPVDIMGFTGMNNTDHPSTLKENVPKNLLNAYSKNGTIEKRNGYNIYGDILTESISDSFAATTYRDPTTDMFTAGWDGSQGDTYYDPLIMMDGSQNIYYGGNGPYDTYTNLGVPITGDGTTLTTATFFIKKFGSPVGNIKASLYAKTVGFPTPTGSSLSDSDEISSATLTSSYSTIDFTFSTPFTLVDDTEYIIAIRYISGTENNFISLVNVPSITTKYNAFCHSVDDGENWEYTEDLTIPFIVNKKTTADWNTSGSIKLNPVGYYNNLSDEVITTGNTFSLRLNTSHKFRSFTIEEGGTLFADSNPTGSVLYISCSETFTCNGSILLNNILTAGQTTNSVTINDVTYTKPGVGNGGTGGGAPSSSNPPVNSGSGSSQTSGSGGGGGGGFAAAANDFVINWVTSAGGNATGTSGGGGGSATAALGSATGGSGGTGGGSGKSGIHLVIRAKNVVFGSNSVVNLSGTNGSNGSNGTNGSITGAAVAIGGGGGGGGGGGNSGNLYVYYSGILTNSGTKTLIGGNAGSGGNGGSSSDGSDPGYTGSAGTSGTAGTATYTKDNKYDTINNQIVSKGYDCGVTTTTWGVSTTYSLNGGTIVFYYSDSANNIDFGAWTTDITTLTKRYVRFKAVMTGTIISSPEITDINFLYSSVSIVSMHSWTRNDSTKYLLAIGGTNIYLYAGSTPIIIKSNLTTDLRTTASAYGNYLIITNGTDNVMRFNGKVTTGTNVTLGGAGHTTVTGSGTKWKTAGNADELSVGGAIKLGDDWFTIASITSDTVLEISSAGTDGTYAYEAYGVPDLQNATYKGKYIAVYKSQVYMSGVSANPTVIYVSDTGDPTNWTTGNAGAINVNTSDGQIVTGFNVFKDILYVHRASASGDRKSVYSINNGFSVDTITSPRKLTDQCSAINQYSIASTPNKFYFVDRGGIFETNGNSFRKVDGSIASTTSTFNQTYLQYACAIYVIQSAREYVLFSVPIGSSTVNNYILCLDSVTGDWSIMTGVNAGCFAIYAASSSPELYFGDVMSASSIFVWDYGVSDNGRPIDWVVETSEINLRSYFKKKKFKYLYAFFESTGDYDVTASYALDGVTTYTALDETIATTSTDYTDVFKRWRLPNLKGSSIRFKLENNEKDQPITLVRIALMAIDKGMRRS